VSTFLGYTPIERALLPPRRIGLTAVTAFARKTGDIAVLSATDLSVIALTYQHEVAENGEKNIRSEPGQRTASAGTVSGSTPSTQPATSIQAGEVDEAEEEEEEEEEVAEDDSEEEEPEAAQGDSEDVVVEVDEITRSIDQVLLDAPAESADAVTEATSPSSSSVLPAQVPTEAAGRAAAEAAAAFPDEDDESDGGEWITPTNVNKHRSHDLGLLPTENANAEAGPIAAACMTGDFAVQNVLLGMGLGLVGEGGKRISKVKSFVLRCHACFK
jgi:RNA-binding protein NOB1